MLHPIAAGTKFKRGIRIIASSVALIGGLCWFACCSTASRRLPLRHILVLHSYAPDNPRCLKMNGLLEKELEKRYSSRYPLSLHGYRTENLCAAIRLV